MMCPKKVLKETKSIYNKYKIEKIRILVRNTVPKF